jgi:hypothetical protein
MGEGWGIIRYRPLACGLCDEDPAAFDGWYARREMAQDIYKDWCRRYPNWVVALVSEEQARFPETLLHLTERSHKQWLKMIRAVPR